MFSIYSKNDFKNVFIIKIVAMLWIIQIIESSALQ